MVAERRVCDALLRVYREDLDRGAVRSEADYRRMFPGHEDEVSAELRLLEDGPMGFAFAISTPRTGNREPPHPADTARRVGPYRLLHELGRGGQAIVYLATHVEFDRRVALKLLRSDAVLRHNPTDLARFRREAEASARLDHPNLCNAYEAGDDDGQAWIAMRYVEGVTLAVHLDRAHERGESGPVALRPEADRATPAARIPAVIEFVAKIACALHFAHERGLVHRDVKPGNVMVTEAGEPCVLDFGLAGDEHDPGRALTQLGTVVGTPYYLAPEQIAGAGGAVDRRTDVYALGVTLYECLTLRRPFEAPSREALYRLIQAGEATDIARLQRGVARDLALVVATAMERDRECRYATAAAFADDLQRVLQRRPIAARPLPRRLRTWRWLQRNPRASALLIASMLVTLASIVLQMHTAAALRQARARSLIADSVEAIQTDIIKALQFAVAAHGEAPGIATTSHLGRVLAEPFPSQRLQKPASVFEFWGAVRAALAGGRIAARYVRVESRTFADRSGLVNRDTLAIWEADGSLAGTIVAERDDLTISGWSTSAAIDHVAIRWMDDRVVFYDAKGQSRATVTAPGSLFVHATARRDALWLSRADGKQVLYEWSGAVQRELAPAPARVVARHVPRDGAHIMFGCEDGSVELRAEDGERLATVRLRGAVRNGAVHLATHAPRGVAALADGSLWLCDLGEQPQVREVPCAEPCILAQVSPDGRRLLTLHETGTAMVWDLEGELRVLASCRDPRSPPRSFEREFRSLAEVELFADDGTRFLTIHDDFSVLLWRDDGQLLHLVAGIDNAGRAPAIFVGNELLVGQGPLVHRFDRDGNPVRSYATGGIVTRLDVRASDRALVMAGWSVAHVFADDVDLPHHRPGRTAINALAVGPDGTVASGNFDGSCTSWQPRSPGVAWPGHGRPVKAVAFSRDGSRFASTGDSTAIVHDLRNGTQRILDHRPLTENPRLVVAVDFSPDGTQLLTSYNYMENESLCVLWDLARGEVVRTFEMGGYVRMAKFAPDGRSIVCGNTAEHVQVRDLLGNVLHEMPQDLAQDVCFVPGTPRLLIAGVGRITWWDPATGAQGALRVVPDAAVFTLCASPDGKRFAAATQDGSAWVYLADGEPEAVLRVDAMPINGVAFSADGRHVLTGHQDGWVRSWLVSPEEALALARRRLDRVQPSDARVALASGRGS